MNVGAPDPAGSGTAARPTVSAVITAYDRPDFLREAIESALAQTYALSEVIVVDDCSPTSLENVVASFGGRVRYERLDRNSGANVARNTGVSIATSDFVAFLDDDDIWLPEKIERQLAEMGPDDEACLCGLRDRHGTQRRVLALSAIDDRTLRAGNSICGTSGLLVRRHAITEVAFDPALHSGQDWDVYVRLQARRPIVYAAEALFIYRHGAHLGLTTVARKWTIEELEKATTVLEKHRSWLGEKAYRRRTATMLLKYFGQREDKLHHLSHAVRRAGLPAVSAHFFRKLVRRLPIVPGSSI